jgi:uncharacterized membrane protein YfcA
VVAALLEGFMGHALVFLVAICAGGISGIVGTGSSLMLLPVLVQIYGPKQAVPIMAIAAVIGNLSRMAIWWRHIDWRAALAYSMLGAPAAALGACVLVALPAWTLDAALGLFFWGMIPLRRYLKTTRQRLSRGQLALCGAGIGFLTGVVLSTGPMSVPAFTAYGLTGGAFLGTEAASALVLYISKVTSFSALGALSLSGAFQGALVGLGILAGTVAGKPLALKMTAQSFERVIDFLLLASGAALVRSACYGYP